MKRLKNLNKAWVYLACTSIIFASCKKDNETPETKFNNGIFITNEGGYGNNNSSVSYYDYDQDSVFNTIFKNENGYTPGDVLQSIYIDDQQVYLVVNNSNKVIIADRDTLREENVVEDLPQPRYMTSYQGKGYISCWGDNKVHVLDLTTQQITGTVSAGSGPEHMLVHNAQLLVANSGGFGSDSTVTVIDLSTQKVTKTLVVGNNPRDIEEDKNGDLWVLCYGFVDYTGSGISAPAQLVVLDGATLQIKQKLTLSGLANPSVLEINAAGDKLYFGGGYGFEGIYELPVDGTTAKEVCTDEAYGFLMEKDHNEIFVMTARSFSGPGVLKRYSTSGELLGSYAVGIAPNGGVSLKNAEDHK